MIKKLYLVLFLAMPMAAFSMHIMEGFLPATWALLWWCVMIPVIVWGTKRITATCKGNANAMLLLALAGAYTFILSALKLPSLTGSCSHPTGMGLGTLLFGPVSISIVGTIVLLFQAILLAHGGITTLGANSFSMAFAGPVVTWVLFKISRQAKINESFSIFLSSSVGSLATYCVTAFQLALAHPAEVGGVGASFLKFFMVFAPTQLPISIIEGVLTVAVVRSVKKYHTFDVGYLRF